MAMLLGMPSKTLPTSSIVLHGSICSTDFSTPTWVNHWEHLAKERMVLVGTELYTQSNTKNPILPYDEHYKERLPSHHTSFSRIPTMDWERWVISDLAISDSLDYGLDRSTWVNPLPMMESDQLHNNHSNLPDKTYMVTRMGAVQKMALILLALQQQLNGSISTHSVPKILCPSLFVQ